MNVRIPFTTGFDPWAVSSMGLADLLEKETIVRQSLLANGMHHMMGGVLFPLGISRPPIAARNFPVVDVNGVIRPLPVAPPGFMVNSPHLARSQQQVAAGA